MSDVTQAPPIHVQYASCTGAILEFQSILLNPEDPTKKVAFYAFLTDMSQTFNSNWNIEDAFGRNDPIAGFQNTRRALSLAWHVPAENIIVAKENMKSVAGLTRMLYPAYLASKAENQTDLASGQTSPAPAPAGDTAIESIFATNPIQLGSPAHTQTLSKPPLVKIKFSNLIQHDKDNGLLGFIDNFSFKPELPMGFYSDTTGLYPKVYSLSCNFNVLHQHDLGHTTAGEWIGGGSFPF